MFGPNSLLRNNLVLFYTYLTTLTKSDPAGSADATGLTGTGCGCVVFVCGCGLRISDIGVDSVAYYRNKKKDIANPSFGISLFICHHSPFL